MKAAIIEAYGSAEQVHITELPDPSPAPDEVLVRVKAAGVNPLDVTIRSGKVKLFTGSSFPKILGPDFSGVIERLGSNVSNLAVGDEVWGFVNIFGKTRHGAHAERVSVPAAWLHRKPKNLSHVEAAALLTGGMTSLQALRRVGLRAGERVLINGASGGVGAAGVQIAKTLGAHVTAVAHGRNEARLKALRADAFIDHTREDFRARKETYDVIYDVAGNTTILSVLGALPRGGRYITTAIGPGIWFGKLVAPLVGRKAAYAESFEAANLLPELTWLAECGAVKAPLDVVLSLDDAAEAHRRVETLGGRGRVVLQAA